MRKMKGMKMLTAMLLIAVLLCGIALADSLGAKVIAPSMKVYSSTSSSRQLLGTLPRGASVSVSSTSGNWARISYRGRSGYVQLNNLAFNRHIKAVTTKSSKIRFLTSSAYRKGTYYSGSLAAGVTVYVAGFNGSYALFCNSDGSVVGYVPKSALRKAN